MCSSISFRKSTRPRNCQLIGLIRNSTHRVNDFVGELTFINHLITAFREEEGEDDIQPRVQRFNLHPTKLINNFVSQNVFTN